MNSVIGKYGIEDRCVYGFFALPKSMHFSLLIHDLASEKASNHLITWNSLDNQHSNQIIYFWSHFNESLLEEFRTIDNRTIALTPINFMEYATIRDKIHMKLTTRKKQCFPRPFNYLKLKNSEIASAFQTELLTHLSEMNINDILK